MIAYHTLSNTQLHCNLGCRQPWIPSNQVKQSPRHIRNIRILIMQFIMKFILQYTSLRPLMLL